MALLTITKDNFEKEILNAAAPALVDFWAPWCGPCRMVSPIVEEIAQENPELVIGKINIDEEPELATRYGVMSIPTLMVFDHGTEKQKAVGARPKKAILQMVGK